MPFTNQIYSVGTSGLLHVAPDHVIKIFRLSLALQRAVGDLPTWRVWQYRMDAIPHTGLDIEGTNGLARMTIVANGKCSIPTDEHITLGKESLVEVFDSVDSFYLVETLLEPFRMATTQSLAQQLVSTVSVKITC